MTQENDMLTEKEMVKNYWKSVEEACTHGRPFSLLLRCPKCLIYFWFVEFMVCPKCGEKYLDDVQIPGYRR